MKTRALIKNWLLTILLLFSFSAFAHNAPINDTVITAKVKSKIELDQTLTGTNVDVTTERGIVNLSGVVDSDTQAGALIEIAQSVSDVRDVDTSKLTVKGSSQPLTDTAITAKVKGRFMQEKLFGDKDISVIGIKVETTNGVVYLSGVADSKKQAHNAVSIAKRVNGVSQVISRVKVPSKK